MLFCRYGTCLFSNDDCTNSTNQAYSEISRDFHFEEGKIKVGQLHVDAISRHKRKNTNGCGKILRLSLNQTVYSLNTVIII